MQQPGESRGPSRLLAYVVSWLNDAQMKPLCPSEQSVGSWVSISPSNSLSTSLVEVGGLWARVNPCRSSLPPLLLPRLKRHARTLLGGERPGRQAQRIHIPLRVIAPKSILDNGSTMSARQRTQIRVDTVVSARLTLSLHSKTKTADGWMRFSELHHDWLPQHVSRFGSFFYWSVFLKPWTHCTSLVLNQRRPAFFVLDLARLGNYIFCLVTRNCFDYFIG